MRAQALKGDRSENERHDLPGHTVQAPEPSPGALGASQEDDAGDEPQQEHGGGKSERDGLRRLSEGLAVRGPARPEQPDESDGCGKTQSGSDDDRKQGLECGLQADPEGAHSARVQKRRLDAPPRHRERRRRCDHGDRHQRPGRGEQLDGRLDSRNSFLGARDDRRHGGVVGNPAIHALREKRLAELRVRIVDLGLEPLQAPLERFGLRHGQPIAFDRELPPVLRVVLAETTRQLLEQAFARDQERGRRRKIGGARIDLAVERAPVGRRLG